jgi:hypothetical protein
VSSEPEDFSLKTSGRTFQKLISAKIVTEDELESGCRAFAGSDGV